jgi:hypothetical protein
MLREHRRDGHVAVYVAEGLTGLEANLLTELTVGWDPLAYTATRGWSAEAMQDGLNRLQARGLVADGALTDEGRRLRDHLEDRTDQLVQPATWSTCWNGWACGPGSRSTPAADLGIPHRAPRIPGDGAAATRRNLPVSSREYGPGSR